MLKQCFSRTAAPNGIIFSMEHPLNKEIQICLNKVPGVIYGLKLLHSDIQGND